MVQAEVLHHGSGSGPEGSDVVGEFVRIEVGCSSFSFGREGITSTKRGEETREVLSRFVIIVWEYLQPDGGQVRRRARIEGAQDMCQLFTGTDEIESVNSFWNRGVHQDVSFRVGE